MTSANKLHLALLIHLANQHKDQLLTHYISGGDITAAQFKVLITIDKGVSSPVEISRRLMMDAGAMSRMIDRMVKRDLVLRATHPQDKRQVVLTLSEKGHEICDQFQHRDLSLLLGDLTSNLTPEEGQQLEQLILKMLPEDVTAPYQG